jgi:tRNA1(Val) A37 N6-methylase TrmN6
LPLTSENFGIIRQHKVKRIIKKHNCLVILDDSKGTGKAQKEEKLRVQIDELIKCGLNRIGMAGGFGPDALDVYFRLKRFYRINFSIDSESGVKSDGETDVEKVKIYLTQLLRNDLPKEDGIQQTKNFLKKNRRKSWDTITVNKRQFEIHPNVFHAGIFPSSAWFSEEICKYTKECSSFCEVGCGAGVISCLAALANPQLNVVATDISPDASKNTEINSKLLGVSNRISVRQGDVLDPILPREKFDLIFWALPFGFLDPGSTINLEDAQVFDPGYRAIRKFIFTAKNHLKSKGRLLLGFSTDLGHFDLLLALAKEAKATLKIVSMTTIQEDLKLQFEIFELSYENC